MAEERQAETAAQIQKVLDEVKGTPEWNNSKSRLAFHKIMRNFVHGDNATIRDEELDRHFLRALTLTQDDINHHLDSIRSPAPLGQTVEGSQYYLVTVTHDRNDQFFATDQTLPIAGTGSKTLNAKFQAKNLYERFSIGAGGGMPGKVSNSPLPDWDSIVRVMTDKNKFEQSFDLTNQDQVNSVYGIVSTWDWKSVQGDLFITPELSSGAFSPALYAIYFFGRDQSSSKQIYLVITADGGGSPQKPFIGLITGPAEPNKRVFDSVNRFAFTYLSNKDNPVKYWMMVPGNHTQGFTLGIQTFFPNRPTPYIEVISEFAPVSKETAESFLDPKFLVTEFMLRKGFLMRDLIHAYYPNSSETQLWTDVGALTGDDDLVKMIIKAMESLGLSWAEALAKKYFPSTDWAPGWDQEPTVSDTSNTQRPGAPTNLVIK
jgi:hypothetical protein